MKITVGKKLTVIFVIILILMLFAAFVSAFQLKSSAKTLNTITAERKFIIKIIDLQATLLDKNHSLMDILMFGQNEQLFNRALRQYEEYSNYIETLLEEISLDLRYLELSEAVAPAIEDFHNQYETEKEHLARIINTYRIGGKRAAAKMVQDSESKAIVEHLIQELKTTNEKAYSAALQKYRTGITIAISIFVMAVLLAIIIATKVGKHLISDIFYLTNSADEISLGSLDTPISLDSNDELGELADVFERLRLDMQKAMSKIHKKK
jgi:CHASE3 domain sensor protein